ncbi:hypothetical protein [Cellulosilyticum sp. I15G10I2]|uniref:hypothetical protein n=1 Tax=Cellulosilyticum sp. I15G10I2 TaxID=1892843 RepID=UPI0009F40D12|nr:hypothetical protein [Cellulosilyticum sp. I15G10I2]
MNWTIFFIVLAVIAALLAGLYFWGKNLQKKYDSQQQLINQHKQAMSIFVIDKKKDHASNLKLPKQVKDQLPWIYKKRKMPVVIAKIGPQIQTLMCDEKLYNIIPIKKQIKVELAGILIVNVLSGKLPDVKKKSFISQIKAKAMPLKTKEK